MLRPFLYLPLRAGSLDFRAYLAHVGRITFLQWFLEKLRVNDDLLNTTVLCGDEPHLDDVAKIGRACDTDVFRVHSTHQVEAFADAADEAGADNVAFFTMELCLAPDDLLTRTVRHHISHSNDYTYVAGLPENSTPTVYRTSLLRALSSLRPQIPSFPSDPRIAMTMLSRLPEKPFPFASLPLDARQGYGIDIERLPVSVQIATPEDFEAAQDIVSVDLSRELPHPLRKLHRWMVARLQIRENTRDELRRRAEPIQPFHKLQSPEHQPRKRVLYVSNPSAFSGAEENLCQLVARLDRSRFQAFALIALGGHFTRRLEELGVEVICPERDFMNDTLDNFLYSLATLRSVAPDIVHFNAIVGMPMVFAATALGVPIVQQLLVADLDPVLVAQLSAADLVLADSEFAGRQALRHEIAPQKIRIIFDPVDPAYFCPDDFDKFEMRGKHGLPSAAKIVLMVARFAPNKRHDVMFAAASLLRCSLNSFHLLLKGELFGPSDCYERARKEIDALELSDRVTVRGFVPDIRELEAAADALVLCSDREALGRCVVEAMSMRLPVVVTNSGGTHEIVEDGRTGFIVSGGDAKGLAARLELILTNPALAQEMGRAGRAFVVESNLNASKSAKVVMGIYDELTWDSNTSPAG